MDDFGENKWKWPTGYSGSSQTKIDYYCLLIISKTNILALLVAFLFAIVIIDDFFFEVVKEYPVIKVGHSEIIKEQYVIFTDGGPIIKTFDTPYFLNPEAPRMLVCHTQILNFVKWFSFSDTSKIHQANQTMFDFIWIPIVSLIFVLVSFFRGMNLFARFSLRVILLISVFAYFLVVVNLG